MKWLWLLAIPILLLGAILFAKVLRQTALPTPLAAPPGIACVVVGQTNDSSGTTYILFRLHSSYNQSVLVGLDGIEVRDAAGWQRVTDGQGRMLAGVGPGGTKTFAFPEWSRRVPWRLRLIYNPPSSDAESIRRQQRLEWTKQAQPHPTVVITTPPLN